jgi:ATP-binding cassette subfamily F protein 3
MLQLNNIFLKFGDRVLFNEVNATIRQGERVGLVGRNGAGKSTLLKVITGETATDGGNIETPKDVTVGILRQELNFQKDVTVREEAMTAFKEYNDLQSRIDELNEQLGSRTDYESKEYEDLIQEISDSSVKLGMYENENPEAQCSRVIKGLGFKLEEIDNKLATFSGGWLMRVEMAKLLLRRPDILLLDEPTNHLDIESILWLEDYLSNYPGIIIIISHDKAFLDNVTNRTIEIELGRFFDIKKNYSGFIVEKKNQSDITKSAFENQQKNIAQTERLIEKFRAKANKAKMAQSLIKQLDRMDKVEVLSEDLKVMKIRFPEPPRAGREMVRVNNLDKYFDEKKVLENVNLVIERGDRVAFVGQNGQGKSTLAKLITRHIKETSGEVILNPTVIQGYYAQNNHETLDGKATLYDTLYDACPPALTTRVRKILGSFLFSGEDIDKKVRVLSGGERARLAMACLVVNPINLLILDEPTNHLDMLSKDTLKEALLEYKGTLIVVSHDRDFLTGLTDKTFEFADYQIKEYLGDINYFLEKREAKDFRTLELDYEKPKANAKKQQVAAENKPVDNELKKSIQKVEKKIQQLENWIGEKETLMGADGFYESADSKKIIADYDDLKSKLSSKEEEWAELVDKMN